MKKVKQSKPLFNFSNQWKPQTNWRPSSFKSTFKPITFKPQTFTIPYKTNIKDINKHIVKSFRNYDTDHDGKPDRIDCQPLNPFKQDITLEDVQKNPSLVKQLTPEQKARLEKEYAATQKVITTIGVYEILKDNQQNTYYIRDKETKETIEGNIPTLREAINDIKKGRTKETEEVLLDVHGAKDKYELQKKSKEYTERAIKHGGLVGQLHKRFSSVPGELVLDMGAGDAPDARATHAIDLATPRHKFSSIQYKTGYDLQKSSIQLPYTSNLFDRVVSYGALGFNFETRNIYKEIYRILIPGGKLEVSRPSNNTNQYMKDAGFTLSIEKYYDPVMQKDMGVLIGTKDIV